MVIIRLTALLRQTRLFLRIVVPKTKKEAARPKPDRPRFPCRTLGEPLGNTGNFVRLVDTELRHQRIEIAVNVISLALNIGQQVLLGRVVLAIGLDLVDQPGRFFLVDPVG